MAKPGKMAADSIRPPNVARRYAPKRRGDEGRVRVDPYLEWAVATRFVYHDLPPGEPPWVPVIMELRKPMTAPEFANRVADAPHGWRQTIRIPSVYRYPPSKLGNWSFCTATVRKEFFQELTDPASALSKLVLRFEFGLPIIATTETATEPDKPTAEIGLSETAVIGVIDDGFAFAHPRFRTNGGRTRIEYLWDQDVPEQSSPQLGYGRELRKRDHPSGDPPGIDTVMAQCTHARLVDEDEVYRLTGHEDYHTRRHKVTGRRGAHGTHVMDLAAGCAPAEATDRFPIVGVQLPNRTTRDTSGASLAIHVLDALSYILNRADLIAKHRRVPALPVVVNLSYGTIAGPHDGHSILEAAIDEAIRLRNAAPTPVPLAVVIPSGNSHLSRCHARFELASGQQQSLAWRVQPDDRTPSFMEIWLPPPTAQPSRPAVRVRLVTPSGRNSPWVKQGASYFSPSGSGVEYGIVYPHAVGNSDRNMILVALAPTATLTAGRVVAPAGTWKVLVENTGASTFYVDAWIQRDDTPYGYPVHGRQSRFDDPAYERFDEGGREIEVDNGGSYVARDGLINALATGSETVVIGGFRRKDGKLAKYSAGGPTAGARVGPDALAVSDDSSVYRGILAAGTRGSSMVALTGTSVAAPQVARFLAEQMAASPPQPGNAAAVRSLAAAHEAGGLPTPMPPPNRGGAGRIDLPAVARRPRFDPK